MNNPKHVSFKSPKCWELGGESVIHCETVPSPPKHGDQTGVRLTHSNSYGPVDDVKFLVRVGDLQNPTRDKEMDSVKDWIEMTLVAESIWIKGEEYSRDEGEAKVDPKVGDVWAGTFEAALVFPPGKQRIEIKVVSSGELGSGVITDWRVKVQ